MTTRKILADDTVYKRRNLDNIDTEGTITITGNDVNVYHYIKTDPNAADPTLLAEMTPDDANPFSAGAYTAEPYDFILIKSVGTSVVKGRNIVV